jgi:hypothetical protein
MLSLFAKSGGFGLFLKSPRGARRWLRRLKKATTQLAYVHQIVNYLCRYENFGMAPSKFNIECAKKFVQKTDKGPQPGTKQLEPRTIGKYWETNKQAAPYIFAFYPFLASSVERAASFDQFVDTLEQVACDQERLTKLIGHAAYAADILANQARKVRVQDFIEVKRVEPQLQAFNADEIQIIGAIDAHRPLSKNDLEDYRPKTITRRG